MAKTEAAARTTGGRRLAFRITTVVLGVGLGVGAFAFLGLVAPWFVGGERDIHRIHDLGWGALGGLLLALPMIVQGWSPERRVAAMQQIFVVIGAMIIGAVFVLELNPFFLIFVGVAAILAFLHPARDSLARPGAGVSIPMAILVLLAAVPLVAYALGQAEIARACPVGDIDTHCNEFHWTTQAMLALAIPLTGLLAAIRTPGWLIPAWTAGAAVVVLGAASLAFPDHASALRTGWAWAAVLGGVAFIGLAEWERRRTG